MEPFSEHAVERTLRFYASGSVKNDPPVMLVRINVDLSVHFVGAPHTLLVAPRPPVLDQINMPGHMASSSDESMLPLRQ